MRINHVSLANLTVRMTIGIVGKIKSQFNALNKKNQDIKGILAHILNISPKL